MISTMNRQNVLLDLPRDFSAPVATRYMRGRESISISSTNAKAVMQLAEHYGVMPITPWLAALSLALSRYTGQNVAMGIAAKASASAIALSRFLIDIAAEATVETLLKSVQEPLNSGGDDSTGFKPQVTVSVAGLPIKAGVSALSRLDFEEIEYMLLESELNFFLVAERAGHLRLECEYDAEVYEPGTVLGMLESWRELARAFPDSTDSMARRLPLWPEELMSAWLEKLRGPVCDIPGVTVDQLVEEQARRTPHALAVATKDEQLTYQAMQARANAVALGIRQRGVRPGEHVAVCMERCVNLVPVLLGVMAAGCAYVPVDPNYPAKRRAFVFADSDVRLIMSDQALFGAEQDVEDARRWEKLRVEPADLLRTEADKAASVRDVDPSGTAYLIYTSGSTGQPKGVCVGHHAAVNLLLAMAERSGLKAGESWLAVTTLAFDISFAELFVPLIAGACTWIAHRDDASDPVALAQLIDVANPRVLQATPSMWRMLISAAWKGKPDLTAITGGEAIDDKLARELGRKVGRLCNVYGPTEATVWATWQDILEHEAISIGAPLRNVELRILDENGTPVPPGVAGELYIGGSGLAKGYHKLEALTQQRFVQHKPSAGRSMRFYRTGDLVRASASGKIRWLARIDDQVKLRGYRIELDEVEAVMNAVPGVRQAVAAIKRFDENDERLMAYVVWESAPPSGWAAEMRNTLRRTLPEYMLPSAIVALDAVPLTDNGKVDRKALPIALPVETAKPGNVRGDAVFERVTAIWKEVLQIEEVGANDNFFDLGGHSMLLLSMQAKVESAFGIRVSRVEFFRNPTVTGLTTFLENQDQGKGAGNGTLDVSLMRVDSRVRASARRGSIAVVGIGLRMPGAANPEEFWDNLRQGVEARTEFSDEELLEAGVDPALLANPDYVRAGFVLEDIDSFDAAFFGMSPREAELLDPQQRIFLECAWQALEDAGIDVQNEGQGIGVYAGTDASGYHATVLAAREKSLGPAGAFQIRINNEKDHLPTRVSYRLNCKGPSVNVQTACSTSLVAVHMAAQSLLRGECDAALAGGVCVHVPHRRGYLYQDGMVASPDGHCRAFDRRGAGTVFGSGAGVVVLKRLEDALAAGDRIYAVVKGSAINNDGSGKVGYTAPSVDGQAAVIMEAHSMAGIVAREVGYVEAHGTATPLGDPIEVAALTQAFRATTNDTAYCAIGSVKTNIGHLDQAAGIAGFIKALLSVYHGEIPPSLHFSEANPDIPFETTPFFVNARLRSWPAQAGKRIAGVSSFGIGGTNAHVILESALPAAEQRRDQGRGVEVLTLSARSEEALRALSAKYARFLDVHPEPELAEICYTANAGRSAFEQRAAWVVRDKDSLIRQLQAFGDGTELPALHRGVYRNRRPRIAMLFTGQGAQYAGMGRELYERDQTFRAALDECTELLQGQLEADLLEVLYGSATDLLNRTDHTQPALFSLEYALRRTWESWGVVPQVVLGHSLGEYVAAQAAGVFSLADGLRLVVRRGQLMQQCCEAGAMMSVALEESRLRQELAQQGGGVVVAAVNGPSQLVVAGAVHEIEGFRERLNRQGVRTAVLPGSRAFHSPLVEPMLEEFGVALSQLALSPPKLALISNVSAELAGAEMATAQYWVEHTRAPVQFARSIESLEKQGIDILLEVGPRPTLVALARQVLAEKASTALTSLRPGRSDVEQMLESLAALQVRGAAVNWEGFYGIAKPRKVSLPTYPFQRKRYWVDDSVEGGSLAQESASQRKEGLHTLLGRRLRLPRSSEVRFEAEFRPDWPSYVDHHRLFGAMVVPGASHIAMFLAAAEEYFGHAGCVLDEILFLRPFVMQEHGRRTVQIALRPTADGSFAFEMMSLMPGRDERDESAWMVHVEGRGMRGPNALPPAPNASELALVKARCTDYLSGNDFYSKVWIPGMDTGSSFRWIDEIWRGEAEALCRTKRPAMLESIDGPFHAGLVESGFQLLNSCWKFETDELLKTDYIYVPFSIDSYRLHGRPGTDQLWVHSQILRQGEGEDRGVTADIRVFEDSGRVIAHVRGFEVRRLQRSVVHALLQGDAQDRLYALQWKRVEEVALEMTSDQGCVLILEDHAGMGAALAERMSTDGTRCIRIRSVTADKIRQVSAEALAGALHVVDLRALNAVGSSGPLDMQQTLCGGVLAVVRALVHLERPAKLTIVTRGAQDAGGVISIESAMQATLAGLARVVAAEHPELGCRTIDLDPAGADQIQALHRALLGLQDEMQVAIRGGAAYVARLTRAKTTQRAMPLIRPGGSYLITGGLGGLGLRLAQGLAQGGVKRLVLMSRSQPQGTVLDDIEAMKNLGCDVQTVSCDVSDIDALRSVWESSVRSGAAPLKGVIHAAGALRDGVVNGQSWEDFQIPLQAKVQGTFNLHALCVDESLDFFVCFSSISALLGAAGQANYAAANAYMDALVSARRALGLPGASIQWGPFAEVGMAARLDRAHREKMAVRGLRALLPEDILKIVESACRVEAATVAACNADWRKYAETESSNAVCKLLSNYCQPEAANHAGPSAEVQSMRTLFDQMALPQLRQAITDYLQKQVAGMLGMTPSDVDPARGLLEMGLDSLAAVELRSRLQRDLQLSLPATFAFDYGNVELGASYLFDRLHQAHPSNAAEGRDGDKQLSSQPADSAYEAEIEEELMRLKASLRR